MIVSGTWANRAQRTRQHRGIFQAGTKVVVKRPKGGGRSGRDDESPGEFYIAVIIAY